MSEPSVHPAPPFCSSAINWVTATLLAAILVTQILILLRVPPPAPTLQDLRNAKAGSAGRELLDTVPLVRVQGTVDVQVENTPLEVQIYR